MKPFRERNPVTVGAIGIVVLLLILVASFNADRLPFIGGGNTYHAAFRESAGLKPKSEVRIAGVKVGKVTGISLRGGHVRVDFRVDHGVALGTKPLASIRIRTVLGQKYLAIEPAGGPGNFAAGSEIPLSRTASPFDVLEAVGGLSQTVEKIDTAQLAKAFDTISTTFKDSPADVKASLTGLSRLSKTISSRDVQLQALLQHANGVTTVLAERDTEFVKLVTDGNLLLIEVENRRAAIHRLLVSTSALSAQLIGLVQDNQAQLKPAMQQLAGVVGVLQRNEKSLAQSIALLGPFVRGFANVLGNGRWFDTYIANFCGPILGGVLPPGGACQ